MITTESFMFVHIENDWHRIWTHILRKWPQQR